MTRFTARRPLLIAMTLAIALVQISPALAASGPRPVVLAAASLQESLNAAANAWAAQGHPRPVLSFAASSTLARQVEAGAPADLFISADQTWMDELDKRQLLRAGTRADLLTNGLVLIAPQSSRVQVTIRPGFALGAALGQGRLATGAVESVPAGIYAKQALSRLGVWPQVAGRIAGAQSVRDALALVARGEAPLGVVYATDAMADRRVRVVATFPESSHDPIVYPVAVLAVSRHGEAEAFRRFLLSPRGRAVFRRFGFGTP
ncbi:MAG: molybdate ABC transporter substrate-binding protein [Sphingomonadales bacterium]|nr:molybdate ABC transporter substrate-binding protein [Sphingomonadales bacterium]MDE2168247.1 molybdate ABC transporter substrate-binding protein [Sphingomonadales bacterium]